MDLLENVGRRHSAEGDVGNFVNVGGMSLNGYERNNLFSNQAGLEEADLKARIPFREVGYLAGADRIEDGRGAAALDIENDGDMDLVIENYDQPARLLVNPGAPGRNWLELRLVGAGPARGGSNMSAVGARVTVRAGNLRLSREVVSAGGYLSGFSQTLHFGLAGAAAVDGVEIRWPSGRVQTLAGLPLNRKHRIEEPTRSSPTVRAR